MIAAVLALVLYVCFSIWVPGFLSGANFVGLILSMTTLGLLGLGMGIVVISRGIDLSMVAVMTCPTAFVLNLTSRGWSVPGAFALGLGLALLIGLLNGSLIAFGKLSPLFATLATGLGLYGIGTTFLTNDIVGWPADMQSWSWIGKAHPLGIPMPLLVFGVVALLIAVLLNRTRVGSFIYAMGDNPLSARAIGIPTSGITILIYFLSAIIAFATGMVMAAVLDVTAVRLYTSTFLYQVILVVVLGGIGLSGGRGGVLSVLLGTFLIGTITNAMVLMNMSASIQSLLQGLLLLAAIIVDSRLNPRNEETAQQGDI
jgi:ribose transport system permease protein